MTFEVGQGVLGINPQGFTPRYGNEVNFSCFFFHFLNFKVWPGDLPEYLRKTLRVYSMYPCTAA